MSVAPNGLGQAPPPVGVLSTLTLMTRALRHRNYKLFFFGQGTSMIGTWMQGTAMAWLVYSLTGSQWLLGVVAFCGQIPMLAVAPLAGVIADRVDRRKMLLVTQTLAMLQALLLAVLTITGVINVTWIISLSLAMGVIFAFDIPTRQAFVVEMLESREDLPNAIALNSFVVNGSRLVGPSLAGLVAVYWGEGICFLLNGISFLAVVMALLAMRIKPRQSISVHSHMLKELGEGISYAAHSRPIRAALLMLATFSLIGMPYMVVMPVFARDILHGDVRTLGILQAAVGVGALMGALVLATRHRVEGLTKLMSGAMVLFGTILIFFAISRNLTLSLFMLVMTGFGQMIQIAGCNTFVQTSVNDDMRGRVMSFHAMCFMGMGPFGSLLIGYLSKLYDAPSAVLIGGVGCIVAGLIFAGRLHAISPARQVAGCDGIASGIFTERQSVAEVRCNPQSAAGHDNIVEQRTISPPAGKAD